MSMPEKQMELFDLAREVLENILRLLELPGKVVLSDEFTVKDAQGNFVSLGLNIEGDDLGILIGRRGQTMGYLQYVLRLIMAHRMDIRIPIIVDVENYRQRRCESLRILANRIAEQVRVRKVPFSMEPMPPFERRVIHLALANHPDVTTQSVGAGEARKVVIVPKKLPGY